MDLCVNATASVAGDFTPPGNAHTEMVSVTNTSHFYSGEGIEINGRYYIIDQIVDTHTLVIEGTALGNGSGHITAVDSQNACFNYPVLPAGLLVRDFPIEVKGGDIDGKAEVPGGWVINLTLSAPGELQYGYLGPKMVWFDANIRAQVVGNQTYSLMFKLPLPHANVGYDVFASKYNEPGFGDNTCIATYGAWDSPFRHWIYVSKVGLGAFNPGINEVNVKGIYAIE